MEELVCIFLQGNSCALSDIQNFFGGNTMEKGEKGKKVCQSIHVHVFRFKFSTIISYLMVGCVFLGKVNFL